AAHVLVAQEQMMRSDLGAHPKAALLGGGNSAHRSGTAQVLEVHTAVLIARELGVASDHRGLAHARDPADAKRRADGALVHRSAMGERRILLVQSEHPAAEALILECLAQHACA